MLFVYRHHACMITTSGTPRLGLCSHFGFLPVSGTLFGGMCLSAMLVISIVAVIVSAPSYVGINCWHGQRRLLVILLAQE